MREDKRTDQEILDRIERLKKDEDILNQCGYNDLKPQQTKFLLMGFCLGRFHTDVIYQIAMMGRTDDIHRSIKETIKSQHGILEERKQKSISKS
jgi:hypothetical protein